jgi:hypothetical protein
MHGSSITGSMTVLSTDLFNLAFNHMAYWTIVSVKTTHLSKRLAIFQESLLRAEESEKLH